MHPILLQLLGQTGAEEMLQNEASGCEIRLQTCSKNSPCTEALKPALLAPLS